MRDIRNRRLYLKATLTKEHADRSHRIEVVDRFIVTKHMYWPVSATGFSPLPVCKDDFGPEFPGDEGQYATYRPDLPQAQRPWQHYLMTDSHAVPPNKDDTLDIAVNPYIEGVIHSSLKGWRNYYTLDTKIGKTPR